METTVKIRLAAIGVLAILFVAVLFAYFKSGAQSGMVSDDAPIAITKVEPDAGEAQPETGKVNPDEAVTKELTTETGVVLPTTTDAQSNTDETQSVVVQQSETATSTAQPAFPSFDAVRINKNGSTVVSGRATPNSSVAIVLDGKVVGEAKVNRAGTFATLLSIDPADAARELSLVQKQTSGEDLTSADKILVMPFKPDASEPPKLVISKPEGVEVITTSNSAGAATTGASASSELSLDTIFYDDLGDVVISGRGNSKDYVRIYLDNKPTVIQKVPDDGNWEITLPNVPDGLYELRVDSVDTKGGVTQRVQSPFKRENVKAAIASISADQANVTIQPGYTLWALANQRYGSGFRYVQIFEANREQIKNPDLIYPGQIFDLPN